MTIQLAKHHGMCFGVRDALRATHAAARNAPVTTLGQLVHNPLVDAHLRTLGVQRGELSDTPSSPTPDVVITAHGASDKQRAAWAGAGTGSRTPPAPWCARPMTPSPCWCVRATSPW